MLTSLFILTSHENFENFCDLENYSHFFMTVCIFVRKKLTSKWSKVKLKIKFKKKMAVSLIQSYYQGWDLLIAHSLISLKSNERLWANRSGRLRQMSNYERFAQVAHQKWATISESLRLLTKNERIAHFLSESLIRFFLQKPAIRSENGWCKSWKKCVHIFCVAGRELVPAKLQNKQISGWPWYTAAVGQKLVPSR